MTKEFSFDDEFLIVDLDTNNPNCANDPNVRIGIVPHYPMSSEEYAQFVSSRPVIGTESTVFPDGISYNSAVSALAKHRAEEIIAREQRELMNSKKFDLLYALEECLRTWNVMNEYYN